MASQVHLLVYPINLIVDTIFGHPFDISVNLLIKKTLLF